MVAGVVVLLCVVEVSDFFMQQYYIMHPLITLVANCRHIPYLSP